MSEQEFDTDRVLTIPNVLSFLRLLAIPVFTWLIIDGSYLPAVIILGVSAATDWFDGYLARRLRQRTKLGTQLDPVTDRLYIIATVVALMVRGIVPWWFVVILLARDFLLVVLFFFLRRTGRTSLPVSFVGKAGTFALLTAFPLILLFDASALDLPVGYALGWVVAIFGAVAYWSAGLLYAGQTVLLVRDRRPGEVTEGKP